MQGCNVLNDSDMNLNSAGYSMSESVLLVVPSFASESLGMKIFLLPEMDSELMANYSPACFVFLLISTLGFIIVFEDRLPVCDAGSRACHIPRFSENLNSILFCIG